MRRGERLVKFIRRTSADVIYTLRCMRDDLRALRWSELGAVRWPLVERLRRPAPLSHERALRVGPAAWLRRLARPMAIAGLCAAVVLAADWTIKEVRRFRAELQATRAELAASKERIARLELWAAGASAAREQAAAGSGRPTGAGPRAPAAGALELTAEELQVVRDYIKVPPAPPGAAPTIVLGGPVPPIGLLPVPPQIGEKVPKLQGARFTTDRNGFIVILRQGSERADAILAPR